MKKIVSLVLVVMLMLSVSSCASKQDSKNENQTTTTQFFEVEPTTEKPLEEYRDSFADTFSGMGVYPDFEIAHSSARELLDNPIDKAYHEDMAKSSDSDEPWYVAMGEVYKKYFKAWEREWDASDKRIRRCLKEAKEDPEKETVYYEEIEKAYENTKEIAEKQIENITNLYYAISAAELGSIDVHVYTPEATMNMYRRAVFTSWQIEIMIDSSVDFVFDNTGDGSAS